MESCERSLSAPGLERIADCEIEVGAAIDIGDTPLGRRRLIPILGGTLYGPKLKGRVLPGGADFQLLTSPSYMQIQARYMIELEQGELLYLENTGVRVAAPEVVARLQAGLPVDPTLVYFRTAPRFETAAPDYAWLMSSLFVGTGVRKPDQVLLSFFRLT